MNLLSSLANELTVQQPLIYHPINHIWVYLLAAAVLQSLAVYTWRYRKNPTALYTALGITNLAVWLSAIVLVTISSSLADKILWVKIELMSSIAIAPTVLLFAVYITKQKPVIISRVRTGLLIVTPILWLALLTNDWHGWIQGNIVWDGVTFGFIRGPLYWAIMICAYLTMITILLLYFHRTVRTSGLLHWQALGVLFALLIGVVGHLRWIGTQIEPISLTPLGFAFSLIWFAISFGLRIFNLRELAESTVTHDMDDSLIIIDARDYIVELNPAAKRLFGEQAPDLIGKRFTEAFASYRAMFEMVVVRKVRTGECSLAGGNYLFRVTPLIGWGKRNIGKVIVLQDIGELKRAQARIIEQQKALSIMTERERLGRELHDDRGQFPAYVKTHTQAVRVLLQKGRDVEADRQLCRLEEAANAAFADVRESIASLKSSSGNGDFFENLRTWFNRFEQTSGITVRYNGPEFKPTEWIEPTAEVQLLRIIQEALINARKHSGAQMAEVDIASGGAALVVTISDNGHGFAAASPTTGFGLKIIGERAAEIGGNCNILSAVGQGTAVTVSIPLTQAPGKRMP